MISMAMIRPKSEQDTTQAWESAVMPAEKPARPRFFARDLQYRLVNPRGPLTEGLRAGWEVWRNGWTDTLRELEGIDHLPSDEFLRQDEIGVLLHEGRCISVTALRFLDFSLPMVPEDSYFRVWPEECLRQLSGVICVSSNTLLPPEGRRGIVEGDAAEEIPLKDFTIRLSLRRFLASMADGFAGVVRNDRAMNRVATDLGARVIGRILRHGIESDVVCYARSDVIDLGAMVESLWVARHG